MVAGLESLKNMTNFTFFDLDFCDYCNRTLIVQVILENVVTFFLGHSDSVAETQVKLDSFWDA